MYPKEIIVKDSNKHMYTKVLEELKADQELICGVIKKHPIEIEASNFRVVFANKVEFFDFLKELETKLQTFSLE